MMVLMIEKHVRTRSNAPQNALTCLAPH